MIRITKAEAERAGLSGRISFPKPASKCKHKWPLKAVWYAGHLARYCLVCGKRRPAKAQGGIKRKPLKQSRTPIAQMSPKRRRRATGWKSIREAIQARDESCCYWCGIQHADHGGTAEHVWPRVHSREDNETNLLWVGSWACHRAKEQMGIPGQIKGLRVLRDKYGIAGTIPETNDVLERNLLVMALRLVQREIDAGVRPSLLRKPA